MTTQALLDRVRAAGYKVELVFGCPIRGLVPVPTPNLLKNYYDTMTELGEGARSEDRGSSKGDLVRDLKLNRNSVIRYLSFVHLLARGRPIWGYDSDVGRPTMPMKIKEFPDDWDRACCEGDKVWIALPKGVRSEDQGSK